MTKKIRKLLVHYFICLKIALNDKTRKNIRSILKEFFVILLKRKNFPSHYFTSYLYRKGVNNYLDYLTNREIDKIHNLAHLKETIDILDNKILFHEHFSKAGIRLPKKVAYNLKHLWFVEKDFGKSDTVEVNSLNEFITLIRNLFSSNDVQALFAKPILSSGGIGALKISKDALEDPAAIAKRYYDRLRNGCFIIQENVVQHSQMSKLNASCLNTIRIATYYSLRSFPEVIGAFICMGRAGSYISNLMSGGIMISIDINTGQMQGNAISKLQHGGLIYSRHPDSGAEFNNFKIPYFEEAKGLACKAAKEIADKLIGWDIGIAPDGPVLIEGNVFFEIKYLDIMSGGLRKNEVFKKVMDDLGLT